MSKKTINNLRKEFPLLKRKINNKPLIYLDNAATTQKPNYVIKCLQEYYTKYNANVHRGLYTLSEQATIEYEHARSTIAQFLHAQPPEIIFTSGTTASLNMLARMLEHTINKDDEIVITIMEHHSNLVPWQELAKRKQAKLKFIALTKDLYLNMEEAAKLITTKTKILAFAYVSNVLGAIVPAQELINLAKKINPNIITIIDAAQAVPYFDINVKELNCDFLAFSGHKVMGPTGIGILYGKFSLLNSLPPVNFGGEMIKEVTQNDASWNELPYKLEPGTPNIADAIALGKAIEYLNQLPREKLLQDLHKLTKYTVEQLQTIPHLEILSNQYSPHPIITFSIKGIHPHDIAEILNRDNICIRAGTHCAMPLHKYLNIPATSRISLYYYNTIQEIDLLTKSLKKVVKIFQ
ncbi:SufS family cysteine desulfurase [Candidatus Woesearchaeota archaeon]|nr:SufS family cysteine desulfurase [Candidatus Woesearchaeota archaeon]